RAAAQRPVAGQVLGRTGSRARDAAVVGRVGGGRTRGGRLLRGRNSFRLVASVSHACLRVGRRGGASRPAGGNGSRRAPFDDRPTFDAPRRTSERERPLGRLALFE